MSRCGRAGWALLGLGIGMLAGLAGCNSGNGVKTTVFPIPSGITLLPGPNVSMEQGSTQSFTVTVTNNQGQSATQPVTFNSSNTSVLTIAANGIACAGSWNSLSSPQICTPGPSGVAEVTASAQGVFSPVTTVYVHQHIDNVTVQPVIPPVTPCLSVGQAVDYQARAFSRGVDITSTVGIFAWQALTANVVVLSTTATGLQPGQVEVTAVIPGVTPIFATIGSVNSTPVNFTTCAVQSIALEVNGNSTGSIGLSKGGAATVTSTVVDVLGNEITGVPLTFSSSMPAAVTVSNSGGISAPQTGGATVTASCTPPTCNIGFFPTLPVFAKAAIGVSVGGTGAAQSGTLYVSSTGCGTTSNCVSTIVPVTTPNNTVGSNIQLPATPNSLIFSGQGDKAYLGTNSGELGARGLGEFDPATNLVTHFPSIPGKVLAVSPDGKKVVISDTTDTPNQVFVFDTTTSTSQSFLITGATAADFSPDSLKAFIVAGSTLYVYSQLEALQSFTLGAAATDVAFVGNGVFGYMAGGDPAGVAFLPTCEDPALPSLGNVSLPGVTMIQPSPDGATMVTLAPPNVQTFSVAIAGTPTSSQTIGCPEPLGFLTGTNTPGPAVNLGQGSFTPTQLIVSSNGQTAYVITPDVASVLLFNIVSQTAGAIPLVNNATPIQASLTTDGTLLYVAADDGMVHVLDTVVGADSVQISFPQNFCEDTAGNPESFSCHPDLVAVKP